VWEAFARFLNGARDGQGPMLLECLTHRRRGHYEGDAERYRDRLEEQEWRRRDPIERLQDRALAEGWVDADAVERVAANAKAEVDHAVGFARVSPFPEADLAAELVYAQP
jgi:pyruvate dehydrogenase E1 component alpha subunit